MNSIIDLIKNRVSCPRLTEPAPSEAEMVEVYSCAMRAPDHARLKPWKYHVVQGTARETLGEVFAQVAKANGDCSDAKIDKCRNMPLRSPLMVVAVCEPQTNNKVPELEQLLSVGAGVQNMQLAISALGYGSVWRTGEMAEAPLVKEAFNVSEKGRIVAFLYVGTPEKTPNKPEVAIDDYVNHWN